MALGRSDRAWLASSWIKKKLGQLRPFGLEKLEAKRMSLFFIIFFSETEIFSKSF
jgi:hypothetical protein